MDRRSNHELDRGTDGKFVADNEFLHFSGEELKNNMVFPIFQNFNLQLDNSTWSLTDHIKDSNVSADSQARWREGCTKSKDA